jgi:hypothetical protein
MTQPRDVEDEMRTLLLDLGTADRLLSGSVAPDDAPPGYAGVAGLLRSCARPLPLDDARERATILAMKQRIRSRPAEPSVSGRTAAGRALRLKLVGVGVGALLVSTSGLAFAGGLPAPAQRVAHTVFASIGVEIPTPEVTTPPEGSRPDVSSVDPSTGPRGVAISSIAKNHVGRAGEHGATVSAVASDGQSQAGKPHGQANETHGQSDQPHGQSGLPHGQSGLPHGQSGLPHGQSGLPHGQSNEPHGQSDQPHGHSDDTHPS